MSSMKIRPEVSKKNNYHISKHRFYELKHYCLQYGEWLDELRELDGGFKSSSIITLEDQQNDSDPVLDLVTKKSELQEKIEMIRECAKKADKELWTYILNAVTKDLSFTELKMLYNIPRGKNQYYASYRRFFFILSQEKHTF